MAHQKSDSEMIAHTHNTARFFVETRHISWVLLFATVLWGVYGYFTMPQRKDPEVPVRLAVALTPWPGSSADKIEQLVTKKIEAKMGENSKVKKIESISRTSISVVYVELDDSVKEVGKEFDDISLKLNSINDLPDGAGPINFIKDFGDTAALMLTVASPKASETEIHFRAEEIQHAIKEVRAKKNAGKDAFSMVVCFPSTVSTDSLRRAFALWQKYVLQNNTLQRSDYFEGIGFMGIDSDSALPNEQILGYAVRFIQDRLKASEFHPDAWRLVLIRDPSETEAKLTQVAGDKYSYRELDVFTDLIERTLKTIPIVSKVSRSGVLDEKIFLNYSQERLASYGIQTGSLQNILKARNITLPGGILETEGKNLTIDPSGEFHSEKEIGDVLLTTSSTGNPVYLRDLVEIDRSYNLPARFLNFYTWKDDKGVWHRSRAVTLSVQMRSGQNIGEFGKQIDATLADLKKRLPSDLVMARTSDQPLQVEESIDLFMHSLMEAIVLVVLVSLIGFWEWRSALLMAISIPITLAMTFGFMKLLGVDLQQVSIATLIIALGLLVDDPVVAGDAIKRDLSLGHPPLVSAWLGPTKLATAIMYATVTNIVAYLPFLTLTGNSGEFIYSLPIVIACSLVASRLVSMTFIPLLGYYLLRPKVEKPIEERKKSGFPSLYYRVGKRAIEHRWRFVSASFVFLIIGFFIFAHLKQEFFPKDLSYLSYVDIWLPEDAPLFATDMTAQQVEKVIEEALKEFGKENGEKDVLRSLTTFVGGGGPRFWFSVSPELQQLNYAQVIIQGTNKHDTGHFVSLLQDAVSAKIPGARVDVRQLETGGTVGLPVAVRISGEDAPTLRALADQAKTIFRSVPTAGRIRDDWGDESFAVELQTDADRANLAGITNYDVAGASATAISGYPVTTLREGDKQIPVVARLRMEERAQLADINNLYVYSTQGSQKIPLASVSSIQYEMKTEKLRRRNQFRTITVSTIPLGKTLPSEIMNAARKQLTEFQMHLPPGYRMEIGGEEEDKVKGFRDMAIVLGISVAVIFLSLVFQFKNAFKPLIVFAAIPYGMVGAFVALAFMGTPFGYMAFLGVVSLVGVIVSHVIVLFDFIEEAHEKGEPLEEALLDAGIMRLRPVLITVGATVIALFPLAAHGGPLWEPLCYAQIGGLSIATFITLLLVPAIYAIFVLDFKLVKWEPTHTKEPAKEEPIYT
ncbi:MAG: AcrB/AcrD/AcrF family protein [Acidobacteria bacterium]|nr:MAG: AcrB/AcrD/AcrF family protein [Acidobacteriota bacterium]